MNRPPAQPMEPPACTRVVGAVLRSNCRVLLCHRRPDRASYPDVWDLPGGHIEGSESPHQALARELEEELGIGVDIYSTEPARTYRRSDLEFIVFVIERWQGEPRNRAPHEHDEVRWFSVDELRQLRLADPSYIELLTKVVE